MAEDNQSAGAQIGAESAPDFLAAIAILRMAGAGQVDAVRLHYLEVLAQRALAHQGSVRRLLDLKLTTGLAQFRERLERAGTAITALPNSAADATLGALVRQLQQHSTEPEQRRTEERSGSPAELKTLRHFRNTWSRLSTDQQVIRALEAAPPNAGPINSHMLVLRSLELMRDISPDYLNRFISYADTLLRLDECDKKKTLPAKKLPVARKAKK